MIYSGYGILSDTRSFTGQDGHQTFLVVLFHSDALQQTKSHHSQSIFQVLLIYVGF